MKLPSYSALIFVTGSVILGVELTASRYMSPMFGSSLYIWGAILSVTLLCLSAGYSWGGRLGEKLEEPVNRLIILILVSAAWIGLLPFVQKPVALLGLAIGPTFGPLLVTAVLFAPPILFLATATPIVFATNNRAQHGDRAASAMGDLFAISTVGSVVGALITAYGLIPVLGLRMTLLSLSIILVISCVPHVLKGVHLRSASILVFTIALAQLAYDHDRSQGLNKDFRFIHHESSRYGELSVLENVNDHSRVLLLDGTSQNMVGGENYDISLFEYTDVMAGHLTQYPSANKNALVLGLGAGVFSRNLAAAGYKVDSVDIDPAVHRIAEDYFHFDSAMTVHIDDARSFITSAEERKFKYGVVVLDVAVGGSQPAHIFNLEAFQKIRNILTDDGVLVTNQLAILVEGKNQLVLHTLATLQQVFPEVLAYDVYPAEPDNLLTNLVVVSSNKPPLDPDYTTPVRETPYIVDVTGIRPLSDNWNPSELWAIEVNKLWHNNIERWLGAGAIIPI